MEQSYCEATAKRRNSPATTALKVMLIIITVLLLLSTLIIPWAAILGVIAAIILIWYWPRFDLMWEYVYCDGQLDFDQIYGGEKRKTKMRIEIEDADMIVPLESEKLYGYKQLGTKDYSSLDPEAKKYVIVIKTEKSPDKVKIVFEPSEKMLEMMHAKCPHTVFVH